jgi:DNA repair protein RadC
MISAVISVRGFAGFAECGVHRVMLGNAQLRGLKLMNKTKLKKQLSYIIPQLKLVLIREDFEETESIRVPSDISKYVEPMRHLSEENFVAFHLDAKNNIIGYQVVSQGTLTASLVHPREVFKSAFLSNANSMIVAHNHPAGSLSASVEDIETTRQLLKAGKLLGVPIIDHIIVSFKGECSIREVHPYLWTESD